MIERPEIRSIGAYDFPSRSAQELYGDDQLVHVWYDGNPGSSRPPASGRRRRCRSATSGERSRALPREDPDWLASLDPATSEWGLDDAHWTPDEGASLASLGVGLKSVIIRMVKK